MAKRSVGAVVVAGGAGLRLAAALGGARKQYLELAGQPVLARALAPFLHHPAIAETVVVLPAADIVEPPAWLRATGAVLVAGGRERSDSVRHGLAVLSPEIATVLIHDAARPFVSESLIDRVLSGAGQGGAIPALPATDTLKEVDGDGRIIGTVDRQRVWRAQTPQAFPRVLIEAAHQRAHREGWQVTDDAALCERVGVEVRVVQGDPANFKITDPFDLRLATLLTHEAEPDEPPTR